MYKKILNNKDLEIYSNNSFIDEELVEVPNDCGIIIEMKYPLLNMENAFNKCLVRKEVLNRLLEAAVVIKKEVDKKTDDEIKEWLEEVKEKNRSQQERSFPYDYKINDNIQGIIDDIENKKQK